MGEQAGLAEPDGRATRVESLATGHRRGASGMLDRVAFHDALKPASAVQAMELAIAAHLFVVAPNNSGSTFLREALATSAATWNLARDGQRMAGFVGPVTWKSIEPGRERPGLLWAADDHWLETFATASLYDWPRTRRAWYFQARSRQPDASVFVTKSPPFLLVVDELSRHFRNARFLFMVRNPYAVCEGICRAYRKEGLARADLPAMAAEHVATCLERQRGNIDTHADQGAFFHYETLCAEPERVAAQIATLVPQLRRLEPAPTLGREVLRRSAYRHERAPDRPPGRCRPSRDQPRLSQAPIGTRLFRLRFARHTSLRGTEWTR